VRVALKNGLRFAPKRVVTSSTPGLMHRVYRNRNIRLALNVVRHACAATHNNRVSSRAATKPLRPVSMGCTEAQAPCGRRAQEYCCQAFIAGHASLWVAGRRSYKKLAVNSRER